MNDCLILIDSIRPEVAKIALMTVSELCSTLKKALDPIVESVIRIVANKCKEFPVFYIRVSSFNYFIFEKLC